jgi:hypothetical protein
MRRRSSSLLSLPVPALASVLASAAPIAAGSVAGAIVLPLAACIDAAGAPAPTDAPAYPTGLAVDAVGDRLVVVGSNFDLAYEGGAVLLADLKKVRADLAAADAPDAAVVDDAYVSSVPLPSFGDGPVVDVTGRHVLLTTRGGNLLHEVTLDDDGLSCAAAEGDGGCDQAPHALQLVGNDPFRIVMLQQTVGDDGALTSARALVTHLSSGTAELVRLDPSKDDASRLRVEAAPITFGDDVFGVRSAVLVPDTSPGDDRVFALVERRVDGVLIGSDLAIVDVPGVDRGLDATIARTDITGLTGALSGGDVVVVDDPARGAGQKAVIALLRTPDAVARFAVDDRSGTVTLTHLDESCRRPTGLATVDVDVDGDPVTPGVPRVLLTCQDSEAVEALDPVDLSVTDAVRFFGRGPYDVVVDAAHQQAFVSFFLDDSIGVIGLVDDGAARLIARGRIGAARPAPEDGRE